MRILPLIIVAAVAGLGFVGAAEPVRKDLSEHVEVRLVTIDVIALDKSDRTVPGLGKDSFRLFVDGTETPIDTVDAFCGDTPTADPESKKFGGWATPPDLTEGVRRVVLAFDYMHLTVVPCPDLDRRAPCLLHTQALDAYRNMLADKPEIHDEEIMVVALNGGLRVEQPFTRDRKAVLETLRRMEYDVTLWNQQLYHDTESGFFRGLDALMTLLHATPGPKSVVLLTAGSGPRLVDDGDVRRLATMASDAQARLYPVDCRGLNARRGFGEFAGPPGGLDRLASSTGGRLTAGSNDFTVGYARARRDLGCRYTIGFYDRKVEENRAHTLRVSSAVPGLKVFHAESYSFPSREARRGMELQAAYMVPSMFEGGGMRAEVFPLEPRDGKTWDALVAIDFPVPTSLQGRGDARREFGVVLSDGSDVAVSFGRNVTIAGGASAKATATRRITFLEPAKLAPGRYTLTAVLSDPGGDAPLTAHTELTVPDIPTGRSFLVGPMLGRRSGHDVVIRGGEDDKGAPADRVLGSSSFRPLIVTETDRAQPLFALTQACASKKEAKRGPWRVGRRLTTAEGEAAGAIGDAVFGGSDRRGITCERYLDQIPASHLRLGAYTFSATLRAHEPGSAPAIERRTASFLLVSEPVAGPEPN